MVQLQDFDGLVQHTRKETALAQTQFPHPIVGRANARVQSTLSFTISSVVNNIYNDAHAPISKQHTMFQITSPCPEFSAQYLVHRQTASQRSHPNKTKCPYSPTILPPQRQPHVPPGACSFIAIYSISNRFTERTIHTQKPKTIVENALCHQTTVQKCSNG